MNAYWRATRAPRYSLLFALPLLLAYEALAAFLSHGAMAGVRNGADVLLKSLFVALGGRDGLVAFGVLLLGGGAALVWRDWRRKGGGLDARYFAGMALESLGYALVFGAVAGTLAGLLLHGMTRLAAGPFDRLGLATQLMVSLGAGIYEELLFRVIVVGAVAWLGRRAFGWSAAGAGVAATIVGALVFSAFHYIGPYGDPLALPSFLFRAVAGVLFSALYLLRGFGIAAWTHALYDILLAV
ncbi:MAG TPA: CPBP family intramembrane glutamic endopeptidase [Gemmatimonadales bacterium]|nr:CPBP family intramembrane glutamic endopeptidase [Gemmatimonadales bacterium]